MTAAGIWKVLVIDDDRDILALAEVALSDLGGLSTMLCANREDALERIKTTRPDAILLDLYLPGAGGREILETLRNNPDTRDLPVVILTAQLDNTELADLRALRISGVIKKPFDPATLAEQLRAHCA